MHHRITHASRGKIYLRAVAWLSAQADQFGTRIFAATDATARQHDWQITPTHAGLGRRYRDPRFDSLAACARCSGQGVAMSGDPCQVCDGTGRVTLIAQATEAPPRPA